MGLFSAYDPDKRCFAYCGDDRCNCDAGPLGRAAAGLDEFRGWFERRVEIEGDGCEIAAGREQKPV